MVSHTFQREACINPMAVKSFECCPDDMRRSDLDLQGSVEVVRMILTKAQAVMYRHITPHLHVGLPTDISVKITKSSDGSL